MTDTNDTNPFGGAPCKEHVFRHQIRIEQDNKDPQASASLHTQNIEDANIANTDYANSLMLHSAKNTLSRL